MAALRRFSRSSGFFQFEHFNYNVLRSKSRFCVFMHGLKHKLDRFPKKKAQAMTTELLTYLLDDILKFEPNRYLALRDGIVVSMG